MGVRVAAGAVCRVECAHRRQGADGRLARADGAQAATRARPQGVDAAGQGPQGGARAWATSHVSASPTRLLGDQSRASDTRPQSRVSGIRGCRAFTGVGRRLRVWRGGVTKPQPMDSPWTAHVERRGGGEGTRRVAPLSAGCMTGCGCDGWAVERRALGIRVTCWGGHPSHLLGWAVERRASAADAAHAAAAAGRRAGAGCCQWLRGTGSTQSRGPAADTAPRGRSLCLSCEVGMGVPLIRAQRRAGLRRRS